MVSFIDQRQRNGVRVAVVSRLRQATNLISPVHRQNRIAKGAMLGLSTVTGLTNNRLAERPFMVFWFMAQVSR